MGVKHTSDQFMGAGERLHLQSWLSAGADPEQPREPAAAIALVHGYGDHGGRHSWFGEDMAARGYAVYAYDLRGHGQSSGTRGQIRRFADYLDDTAIFLDEVRRRQPGRPVVLLGHSLGGLICARFAQERPCDVRALVLSSPFFALTVQPEPMKVVGAKALSAVWPGRDIGNTVRAADLSHDQAVVDAYVTDPLVHHVATARWAAETLAAQDAAMSAAPRVTLPLLLVYGKDDQVADPAFAEAFFATVGSADKKLIHYEGFYHELFNEVGREQVFGDVAAWLARRLPAVGAGESPAGASESPAGGAESPDPLAGAGESPAPPAGRPTGQG